MNPALNTRVRFAWGKTRRSTGQSTLLQDVDSTERYKKETLYIIQPIQVQPTSEVQWNKFSSPKINSIHDRVQRRVLNDSIAESLYKERFIDSEFLRIISIFLKKT